MKECKNKKTDLLRDRPLTFCRMPSDETEMMELLHSNFDFEPITRKLRAKALLAIVLCGIANSKHGHFTSFSCRKGWYTRKRLIYGDHFTYSHIDGAFKAIRDNGMLIELRARKGARNKQSVFMATPELISVCRKLKIVEIQHELIVVKDNDKLPIEYEETEFSRQRRADLESFNKFYEGVDVSFDEAFRRGPNRYEFEERTVIAKKVQVHCTFNRSSFLYGGRLFSWITSVPKEFRPYMLLNGQKTVELDYKQNHPTILFAQKGLQLNRDVYSHNDFPREWYKTAFLAALNGLHSTSAAYSMWKENRDKYGFTLMDCRTMVQNILRRTPEIEDMFFADAGVQLQRIDSGIIVQVLKMLIGQGIPAVSIHDSVVVPEEHEVTCHDVMKIVYMDMFSNLTCQVSSRRRHN